MTPTHRTVVIRLLSEEDGGGFVAIVSECRDIVRTVEHRMKP